MSDPPAVRILPDSAGYLLQRRTLADGRQVALLSWTDVTPGPRGGLVSREEWLPMELVGLLPGVDYSGVDHEHLTEDPNGSTTGLVPADRAAGPTPAARPTGWPAEIPLPGDDPSWTTQAAAFLLECIPPDYRAHRAVHDPHVLVWMATHHVEHALAALRAGYRAAAVDFKPHLPPHVIAEVLETYRAEGRRLTAAAAAIRVVGPALRGRRTR